MPFTINFSKFVELTSQNPLEIVWFLFVNGGWIPITIMTAVALYQFNLLRLQGKFLQGFEYVLLAIDIPKASEQTPKAMEQVFATITGAHSPYNKKEIWIEGKIQLPFSWEIISIDGYIQFLVRTPKVFRDLVESAIYAHYPDAEITEVEDYTKDVPTVYPNDRFNVWGAELTLVDNEAQPIRTYESFEDRMTQEFKDPLAGLIETMSRVQQGEQVWLQIITNPIENNVWVKRVLNYAYKKAGKKTSSSRQGPISATLSTLFNTVDFLPWSQPASKEKGQQLDFRILNLTPGERSTIEAIEKKAVKLGYSCKIRLVYISPNEIYSSKRVVSSVFGAIKQFGDLTSNSLKPNKRTKTQVAYFNVKRRIAQRRMRIVRNFKNRSWYSGSKTFVLNTEELATLYHFPAISVTSPYLKRTEAKKSEAPVHLPKGFESSSVNSKEQLEKQLLGLDLNNDYYERLYAKGGTKKKPVNQELDVQRASAQHVGTESVTLAEKTDNKRDISAPDNLPV